MRNPVCQQQVEGLGHKQHNFWLLPYLCGFCVIVFIGRIQELFPHLSSFYLGKVAFAVSFIYFIFTIKIDSIKEHFKDDLTIKYILAIFFIAICSIPLSVWPTGSIKFVTDVLFLNMFFYFILSYASKNENNIIFIINSVVISVAIIAIVAFNITGMDRVSVSYTYDSNDTAYIMVCFLPLVYYSAKARKGILKLMMFLLVGVMMVVIIKTGSRGGFLGLLAVVVMVLLKERKNIIKTLLFATLLTIVFSIFAGQDYWDKIASIADTNDYNYNARGGRLDLWKSGIKLMFSNPVLGVGVGQYNVAEGLSHADVGGKWSTAHNAYIQIGVELGLPGFFFFLLLLVHNITSIRKIQRQPCYGYSSTRLSAISSGLEIGLYGYCACAIFLSQAYSPVLMYLSAMITGLKFIYHRFEQNENLHACA